MTRGAVDVSALTVRLRRETNDVRSLRQYVIRRMRGETAARSRFDVIADVSFEVSPGELFAVVGPNGAGKTTLLRVLAGIVPPARGTVSVRGRLAPLIELGAGFDPELTGAENIRLYGSLLGMRAGELEAAHEDIVAFSGVGGSLEVPVRHYSSGMLARLGFAIATSARPDVLLVDEVIAVGDEQFRRCCRERIRELRRRGTCVVLVTHDLDMVASEAQRALHLDAGRCVHLGGGAEVAGAYRQRLSA